jgi:hypothetical protein
MSIFLFVKGAPKSARREAARRNIAVKNCRVLKSRAPGQETKCETPCKNEAAVSDWYRDPHSSAKPGRGFAPGALLFYNSASCIEAFGRRARKSRRR